uniref:BTB domain-containing protein n=1 Tax=Panagrellus redivivus TaxID=6233 RepID=A0A7E4V0R1_PANRE
MTLHCNTFICDDNFDWFFTHIAQNNVKTSENRFEKIDCKAGKNAFDIRLHDSVVNMISTVLQDLHVGVEETESDQSGCKNVRTQVYYGLDHLNRVCPMDMNGVKIMG